MPSLFDQIAQQLNAETLGEIARQIGAKRGKTEAAVQAAVPMLLGALAHNSATKQGAAGILGALERDHDGSLLEDLGGFLGGLSGLSGGQDSESGGHGAMDAGGAILGHLFGGKQGDIASRLSQVTGLQSGQILQLLAILAPIVMAALGKQHKESGGLDPGGLADILGGAFQRSAAQAPASVTAGSGGGIGDFLSSVLDGNRDGSVMDDLMQQGGGLLGSLLGGPRKG